MKTSLVISLFAVTVGGCLIPEDDDTGATVPQELSGAARRPRSERIRDVARAEGLTNGVLLAGIAQVETGLSHCWSEATWACQGPTSSFCNGPVIAGASDGPCSDQQGGLGMFQFDGGTYQQTLARDGQAILQLDGNIAHVVDFVVGIVIRDIAGVDTRAQALAWMNGISVSSGNARFTEWNALLACRYNGRCGSATQAAKYRDATLAALGEFGAAFWAGGAPPPPPGGTATAAEAERLVVGTNQAGALELFFVDNAGAIQRAVRAGSGWAVAPLGGAARTLAIGNNADGRLELFWVGTDDQLYHRVQLATGAWSGQIAVGTAARDVTVGRNSDGRMEAFYADAGSAIHHLWQIAPNDVWTATSALGGAARDLVVGANADGRLELFWVGTSNLLLHRVQRTTGGWSGELAFNVVGGDLAVGRNPDGRLELAFNSGGNTISHAFQLAPNGAWSAGAALGGLGKRVVVGANADGRLEVFYIGTSDLLFHRVQLAAGGWSGELAFNLAARDLAVGRNPDGRLELFYATPTGAIHRVAQTAPNSGWGSGGPL